MTTISPLRPGRQPAPLAKHTVTAGDDNMVSSNPIPHRCILAKHTVTAGDDNASTVAGLFTLSTLAKHTVTVGDDNPYIFGIRKYCLFYWQNTPLQQVMTTSTSTFTVLYCHLSLAKHTVTAGDDNRSTVSLFRSAISIGKTHRYSRWWQQF